MKKVALVFVLAVFVPSLVLACLAIRSSRHQQFIVERQRSLLCQSVTDALADNLQKFLAEQQQQFRSQVEGMLAAGEPRAAAAAFDESLRAKWPMAEVGFVVTTGNLLLCPSPASRVEARDFCADNGRFLCNRELAEVYANPKQAAGNWNNGLAVNDANSFTNSQVQSPAINYKSQINRSVEPQQQVKVFSKDQMEENKWSKMAVAEAEFRQLIGDQQDGALARFVGNKLNVLFWYRPPADPNLIFGVQLGLAELTRRINEWAKAYEPDPREGVCLAILDDKARPVMRSREGFTADWKHPFVATEIGETLPHWEAVIYLTDPNAIARSARAFAFTIGLLIALLLVAIATGGWLVVRDLNRQLTLARQKTDFVSNVSHELKTPLTSIRMFAELMAEGRVTEPEKQRGYLQIITAEAARLTRLINNVLDFARLERGEKKYNFAECDLAALTRETAETFRPHLEASGFKFEVSVPEAPLPARVDRDAIAQVIVNLLSNAEKYSNCAKEVRLELERRSPARRDSAGVGPRAGPEAGAPMVDLRVLDRGPGVPAELCEKIFEQFFRVNDSLTNSVQGTGLGLTLARQIARAHGGDVAYSPREGGGSCFTLQLGITQTVKGDSSQIKSEGQGTTQ